MTRLAPFHRVVVMSALIVSLAGCERVREGAERMEKLAQLNTASGALDTAASSAVVPVSGAEVPDAWKSLMADQDYILGGGDVIRVRVAGDEALSGEYTVGPDGKISVPIAGTLKLSGLSREKAMAALVDGLKSKYESKAISMDISKYANNRIYVLGRVEHSVVDQVGESRLLNILAAAGSMPVQSVLQTSAGAPVARPAMERCAIIRGNDVMIWIDLTRLMRQGDLKLNLPLRNNDVIFLPDASEQAVYVMGAVEKPGRYPLIPKMRLIDGLAEAGGVTSNGRSGHVLIAREDAAAAANCNTGVVAEVDVRRLMEKAAFDLNVELRAGDIVYVRASNMAKVGLFFQRVGPGIQLMSVGANVFDTVRNGSSTTHGSRVP